MKLIHQRVRDPERNSAGKPSHNTQRERMQGRKRQRGENGGEIKGYLMQEVMWFGKEKHKWWDIVQLPKWGFQHRCCKSTQNYRTCVWVGLILFSCVVTMLWFNWFAALIFPVSVFICHFCATSTTLQFCSPVHDTWLSFTKWYVCSHNSVIAYERYRHLAALLSAEVPHVQTTVHKLQYKDMHVQCC